MNNITFKDLIEKIMTYDKEGIGIITKAYEYADLLHTGQLRQSGEPYIIHPLNVAYILAEMHADRDTICAALLHDTLEDTTIKKEEIVREFNSEVAKLVDGVTKLSKMNFSSKEALNYANTRKIITSITEDVRTIIIKLADRLHNMRTLQFKTPFKQKENALETIEIFVPLAFYIGAYRIKSELEDISLKYLKPDKYKKAEEIKFNLEQETKFCLQEMLFKIRSILNDKNIPNEIKIRTKNIYGIYKKLEAGHKLSDIHDLLALKIMVDEIDDCYRTMRWVHLLYHPVPRMINDYICNPKSNMYQSLHSTVFGPEDRLVHVQIRTFNMDRVASFGLTTYWDINKGDARTVMQEELKQKFQFFKSLTEMNAMFGDNQDFVRQVKIELFSDNVYVYTTKGEVFELPKGSTPIDFAYRIHTNVGNTLVKAIVNDECVPLAYSLKSLDRVRVITDELSAGPQLEWLKIAKTAYARRRIKDAIKNRRYS